MNGDGKKIKFWTDLWLSYKSLPSLILPGAHCDINASVCAFWDCNGWNMNLLASCLP